MNIEEHKLLLVNIENNSKMVFDNFVIVNRRFDNIEAVLDRIESFLKRLELGISVLESELLAFGRKDKQQPNPNGQDSTKKSTNDTGAREDR